jgi:hypothetical protein
MDQLNNHPLYGKHNIDSAMNSLWTFYKSRFLPLFLISLVMSLVIQYSTTLFNFKELSTITDLTIMLEKIKGFLMPMVIIALISLLFSTVLHYYILYNPLDRSNNIFICFIQSLKYYILYLIILVLLVFVGSFVLALGLVVFIIGVFFSIIYIMMVSFFILPVMMAERINIASTISRTISLSHKNFWPNIGWTTVFLLLYIIISLVLSGIIMIPFSGSFIKTIINPEDAGKIMDLTTNPVFIILSAVVNALTIPLIPIFAYILYFNGRAREVEVQR